MRGYRRLITALSTIAAILAPIMVELDMTPAQVVAITCVGLVALIGYNGEDWIQSVNFIRDLGQTLIEVADEMNNIDIDARSTGK